MSIPGFLGSQYGFKNGETAFTWRIPTGGWTIYVYSTRRQSGSSSGVVNLNRDWEEDGEWRICCWRRGSKTKFRIMRRASSQ